MTLLQCHKFKQMYAYCGPFCAIFKLKINIWSFTCQNYDLIRMYTAAGDARLILTIWGFLTHTQCMVHERFCILPLKCGHYDQD